MIDLYAILGIGRDADTEDIKRAYRQKAKKAHPDAGGNDFEMSMISSAYRVLSNAEQRAEYDRTGEVPENAEDSETKEAREVFAMLCEKFFLGHVAVASVKKSVSAFDKNISEEIARERERIARDKKRIESTIARIVREPENSILRGFLEQKIKELADAEKALERKDAVREKVVAMFDEYEIRDLDSYSLQTVVMTGRWQ